MKAAARGEPIKTLGQLSAPRSLCNIAVHARAPRAVVTAADHSKEIAKRTSHVTSLFCLYASIAQHSRQEPFSKSAVAAGNSSGTDTSDTACHSGAAADAFCNPWESLQCQWELRRATDLFMAIQKGNERLSAALLKHYVEACASRQCGRCPRGDRSAVLESRKDSRWVDAVSPLENSSAADSSVSLTAATATATATAAGGAQGGQLNPFADIVDVQRHFRYYYYYYYHYDRLSASVSVAGSRRLDGAARLRLLCCLVKYYCHYYYHALFARCFSTPAAAVGVDGGGSSSLRREGCQHGQLAQQHDLAGLLSGDCSASATGVLFARNHFGFVNGVSGAGNVGEGTRRAAQPRDRYSHSIRSRLAAMWERCCGRALGGEGLSTADPPANTRAAASAMAATSLLGHVDSTACFFPLPRVGRTPRWRATPSAEGPAPSRWLQQLCLAASPAAHTRSFLHRQRIGWALFAALAQHAATAPYAPLLSPGRLTPALAAAGAADAGSADRATQDSRTLMEAQQPPKATATPDADSTEAEGESEASAQAAATAEEEEEREREEEEERTERAALEDAEREPAPIEIYHFAKLLQLPDRFRPDASGEAGSAGEDLGGSTSAIDDAGKVWTQEEIKKKYREAVKRNHPDLLASRLAAAGAEAGGGESSAPIVSPAESAKRAEDAAADIIPMETVNEAYRLLLRFIDDEGQRASYALWRQRHPYPDLIETTAGVTATAATSSAAGSGAGGEEGGVSAAATSAAASEEGRRTAAATAAESVSGAGDMGRTAAATADSLNIYVVLSSYCTLLSLLVLYILYYYYYTNDSAALFNHKTYLASYRSRDDRAGGGAGTGSHAQPGFLSPLRHLLSRAARGVAGGAVVADDESDESSEGLLTLYVNTEAFYAQLSDADRVLYDSHYYYFVLYYYASAAAAWVAAAVRHYTPPALLRFYDDNADTVNFVLAGLCVIAVGRVMLVRKVDTIRRRRSTIRPPSP